MKEIVLATQNKGKIAELILAVADLPLTILSLSDFPDIPEAVENGSSFEENALLKAKHYVKFTGKACLADDSGLEVDALYGAPGIYSARFAGEHATDDANNQKLIKALAHVPTTKRTARFRCVLAFVDTDGTALTADGVCEGRIGKEKQGEGGFGYDSLFYVPALDKTMAEISKHEKNAMSHRGHAVAVMVSKLGGYLK